MTELLGAMRFPRVPSTRTSSSFIRMCRNTSGRQRAMASLKVSTVARRGGRLSEACDFATVDPSQSIRAIRERSSSRLLRDPPRLIGSGMQNPHFLGGKVTAIGSKFRPDYPSHEGRSRRSSPAIPPSLVSFTPRSTRPFIAPLMGANRGDRFRSTGPPDLQARAFTA
jgi:hypothetical protein